MSLHEHSEEQTKHLQHLTTESSNPSLIDLDAKSILERLEIMNSEDVKVALAIKAELPHIAEAVKSIVSSFRCGGRLIYIGAGSSGRLGVLDAAECPPTFSTPPEMVIGILAGGPAAMFEAVEGAEDDPIAGAAAVDSAAVGTNDTVVGISASGQAPFVLGALMRANALGAATIALTNNRPSKLEAVAGITIAPIVGPEVIAGSTRMKSGTSQKMVLNMLTTNAMIEIGKTYGTLMVDVKTSNSKLRVRGLRIVIEATGAERQQAQHALQDCEGNAKLAILTIKTGLSPADAKGLLAENSGSLRKALQSKIN
jgi:N-acetylmuramic acid 6-phosphate etherase